jgi:hypothetical protein
VLTDYGWTWASDYSWGWATFHYGRWSYTDSFGWFWVPDNQWGPAWVNWRQADGYYGWSPMEPGISVSMSFGRSYDSNDDHWLFVRDQDFERTDIHNYYANRSDHDRIVRNSTIINTTYIDRSRHTTYVSGPSRESVQHATGRTITPLRINENNKPGQEISNGQIRIYRPQVVKSNNGEQKPAPARVVPVSDVKRLPARNATHQNQIGNPTTQPQHNNTQPNRQQNINQQENSQTPKSNLPNPVSPNRAVQPVPVTNPTDNNRPVRKPDAVTPQNNNPQQTVPQRSVTPQNNTVWPQQQRDIVPQDKNTQPVKQPAVTAPNKNTVQPQPQRIVTPQNNNSQPAPQRTVTPQDNNKQPQKTVPANVENKTQTVQPQPVNKPTTRPMRQRKPLKQQVKTAQAKMPDVVTDKK